MGLLQILLIVFMTWPAPTQLCWAEPRPVAATGGPETVGQTPETSLARAPLLRRTLLVSGKGWRQKYGGMDAQMARHLKGLEKQNVRLKKLVADQARGHRVIAGSTRKCAPGCVASWSLGTWVLGCLGTCGSAPSGRISIDRSSAPCSYGRGICNICSIVNDVLEIRRGQRTARQGVEASMSRCTGI